MPEILITSMDIEDFFKKLGLETPEKRERFTYYTIEPKKEEIEPNGIELATHSGEKKNPNGIELATHSG